MHETFRKWFFSFSIRVYVQIVLCFGCRFIFILFIANSISCNCLCFPHRSSETFQCLRELLNVAQRMFDCINDILLVSRISRSSKWRKNYYECIVRWIWMGISAIKVNRTTLERESLRSLSKAFRQPLLQNLENLGSLKYLFL